VIMLAPGFSFDVSVFVAGILLFALTLSRMKVAFTNPSTSVPVKVILGSTAFIQFGIAIFSLVIPRGPIQGPWQLVQIFFASGIAMLNFLFIYVVKIVAESVLAVERIATSLNQNMEWIFTISVGYIVLGTTVGMIGILATDELRYEAAQYLVGCSAVPFYAVFGIQRTFTLISKLREHIHRLRAQIALEEKALIGTSARMSGTPAALSTRLTAAGAPASNADSIAIIPAEKSQPRRHADAHGSKRLLSTNPIKEKQGDQLLQMQQHQAGKRVFQAPRGLSHLYDENADDVSRSSQLHVLRVSNHHPTQTSKSSETVMMTAAAMTTTTTDSGPASPRVEEDEVSGNVSKHHHHSHRSEKKKKKKQKKKAPTLTTMTMASINGKQRKKHMADPIHRTVLKLEQSTRKVWLTGLLFVVTSVISFIVQFPAALVAIGSDKRYSENLRNLYSEERFPILGLVVPRTFIVVSSAYMTWHFGGPWSCCCCCCSRRYS